VSIQVLLYTDILVQTIARSQDYTVCKSHTPVQSGNAEGFSLYCKGTVLPVDSTCSGLRYAYLVFQRHGAPYSPSCRRNWYGPFQRPCSAYGSTIAPTDHVWLREPGSKQWLALYWPVRASLLQRRSPQLPAARAGLSILYAGARSRGALQEPCRLGSIPC
jgi:hypothetical protein